MLRNIVSLSLGVILAICVLLHGASVAQAQSSRGKKVDNKKAEAIQKAEMRKAERTERIQKAESQKGENTEKIESNSAFSEAVKLAKQSGKPLVVFGMSEGCHRCAALKEGLEKQAELKLLMTQYVTIEIPFGNTEFRKIFSDVTRNDGKNTHGIGAPAVFMFTAKGDTVYYGPDKPEGMQPNDEFKDLLIEGLKKNGGLRGSAKPVPVQGLAADLAIAQKHLKENQPLVAATLLSKYLSLKNENSSDELEPLIKLTKLSVAKSKSEEQLDSLMQEVSEKGLALLESAVTAASTGDATRSAVQLAALDRVFGSYPALASKFDTAWKELLEKANIPNLKEQAKLIDNARQIETDPDSTKTIAAYELVSTTYPGTKAAELSQLRITQLKTTKSDSPHIWKSKKGESSVTATLVAIDGKSVQLRTDKGKTISVKVDDLSAEDQEFLKTAKP